MRRLLALLRRRIGGNAPEPVPAQQPVSPLDDLRHYICREVAAGYSDDDAVLRMAAEVFADEIPADELRARSQDYLRQALRTHRDAQVRWPSVTDCDRLDAAFDALEADGVVARQNFTCCGTCGVAEIGDEIAEVEDAGLVVRGYAFFHAQDTEAAVEYGDLYLNYGSVEGDDAASIAIGREVAARLAAHGLTTDWDGDLAKRIGVTIDWQRRR